MVLGHMFKSLIHFKSIFVSGVRQGSNFIVLPGFIQLFQQHVLERLFSPPLGTFGRLLKINFPYMQGFPLCSLFCFAGVCVCFHASVILL